MLPTLGASSTLPHVWPRWRAPCGTSTINKASSTFCSTPPLWLQGARVRGLPCGCRGQVQRLRWGIPTRFLHTPRPCRSTWATAVHARSTMAGSRGNTNSQVQCMHDCARAASLAASARHWALSAMPAPFALCARTAVPTHQGSSRRMVKPNPIYQVRRQPQKTPRPRTRGPIGHW